MQANKGFTLIEVLIALVIVAVGVLGHAKMQMKSMGTVQRASFAQTANTALLDLAQRLRANSDIENQFITDNLDSGDDIESTTNCSLENCSESEFADYELAEWFTHLQNNLPSPRFSVTKTSSLYTITLIWDAAKTGEWNDSTYICDTTSVNSYQCGSMDVWVP